MNVLNKLIKKITIIMLCFLSYSVQGAQDNKLSLNEVIEKVIQHYPSIKIAQIEVEQARQEFAKINSRLGWVLSAQSGLSHDVGAFDIPSDRFDLNANVGRTLKSGDRIELSGQYTYEDSDSVAIPAIVNPSERTRLDLNYRIPFAQGDENPNYSQGLVAAQSGYDATVAEQVNQIDNLILQTANLYFDAATTLVRIKDANAAITRASRLLAYVKKNKALGLVEKKDLLDVQALHLSKIAERDNLLTIWSRQRSELNRIMGNDYSFPFKSTISISNRELDKAKLLEEVYKSHPGLILQKARLKTTEAELLLAKDAQKDKLDLVLSVGARNTTGDTTSGNVSNSEWAGGARLEYQYSLDKRGFDADLYNKVLQRDIIQEDINRIKTQIDYDLSGLLEQIERSEVAIRSTKQRLEVEKQKVADAFKRYQTGRTNTNELIDNENALFASSLLFESRKIELARRFMQLDLLLGALWDRELVKTSLSPGK